jgi:hypothetical protein
MFVHVRSNDERNKLVLYDTDEDPDKRDLVWNKIKFVLKCALRSSSDKDLQPRIADVPRQEEADCGPLLVHNYREIFKAIKSGSEIPLRLEYDSKRAALHIRSLTKQALEKVAGVFSSHGDVSDVSLDDTHGTSLLQDEFSRHEPEVVRLATKRTPRDSINNRQYPSDRPSFLVLKEMLKCIYKNGNTTRVSESHLVRVWDTHMLPKLDLFRVKHNNNDPVWYECMKANEDDPSSPNFTFYRNQIYEMRRASNTKRARFASSSVYQACMNLLDLIGNRKAVGASVSQSDEDDDDATWGGFPFSRTSSDGKSVKVKEECTDVIDFVDESPRDASLKVKSVEMKDDDSDVIDFVDESPRDASLKVKSVEMKDDDSGVIDLTHIGTGTPRSNTPLTVAGKVKMHVKEQHLSMDKSEYSILNCTTLTDEQIQTVVSSFSGDASDVLTNDDSMCEVKRREFKHLKDGKWLNDSIIHSYLMLLQQYVTTKRICNVHVFDPFFWSLLLENPYSEMKSWTKSRTKNVNIFELDILYIPINIGNSHWASIAVFFKESRIVYYDSLLVEDKDATERMDCIFRYLTKEWEENHKYFGLSQSTKPIRNQWIFKVATVPKQTNGNDCGVYVCAFAQCVLFDTNVNTVTPSVITKMRHHIG